MPPLAPWPHRLPPPTPPPPLPPQPPPPPPQRTKKQRHRDRRRSLPSTPSTSLEGKLNEIMQYTDAAPSEMRRHQQMAHAVCRQGEDLVSLVHNADVPRLRERACEAHARYVTARQKLQGRIADPELWVFGAACAISRIAGHGTLEVLEGYEQCLGKPSL